MAWYAAASWSTRSRISGDINAWHVKWLHSFYHGGAMRAPDDSIQQREIRFHLLILFTDSRQKISLLLSFLFFLPPMKQSAKRMATLNWIPSFLFWVLVTTHSVSSEVESSIFIPLFLRRIIFASDSFNFGCYMNRNRLILFIWVACHFYKKKKRKKIGRMKERKKVENKNVKQVTIRIAELWPIKESHPREKKSDDPRHWTSFVKPGNDLIWKWLPD